MYNFKNSENQETFFHLTESKTELVKCFQNVNKIDYQANQWFRNLNKYFQQSNIHKMRQIEFKILIF